MKIQKQILKWYLQCGVSETIGQTPCNRFSPAQESRLLKTPLPAPITAAIPTTESEQVLPENLLQSALQTAQSATCLEELKRALESFEGCALKKTAKNTVFGQGNPHSKIMFIGEAPGADEDRLGLPFVGLSGQLLDKIMQSIGLSRQTNAYISNIIPWRPPGNRAPSDLEISLCLPFIKRHIELVAPQVIVVLGSVAFTALLGKGETISKARGIWHSYQTEGLVAPVAVLPVYHPAFLLRTPAQKKTIWRDFLMIKEKLNGEN